MKYLIPMLCIVVMLAGCSKRKMDITTPENATLILLCYNVLQTNEAVEKVYLLDEVIKGSLDPKFLDESKIIKGFSHPTIENENIPEKSFIFGRPKAGSKGTDWFRLEYQYSGISVYDETILEHKNDIRFLQREFDRQMEYVHLPTEEDFKRIMEQHEKQQNQGMDLTRGDAD